MLIGFDENFFISVGIGKEGDGSIGILIEVPKGDDALGFRNPTLFK
jgi:hypothetical protein